MNYVEAEGSSIDEAIERALRQLGVTRDRVDVEIISNATRGLFGFGGRRAKVRATLRRPLTFAAEPTARPAIAAVAASAAAPEAAPPRRSAASIEPHGARSHRPTPRKPQAEARRRHSERTAAAAPLDAATVERGRAVLAEIVRLIGSEATVEAARDGDRVRLVICGDSSGTLIGRRGQTLDALEYVLNRILAHEDESSGRLMVDLEGYRDRRRQALEALARRVAERVRRRGKPVTLNPMSPRDRRVVHLALQDDPTLSTRSAGSGFYRKIVVVPVRRGPGEAQ